MIVHQLVDHISQVYHFLLFSPSNLNGQTCWANKLHPEPAKLQFTQKSICSSLRDCEKVSKPLPLLTVAAAQRLPRTEEHRRDSRKTNNGFIEIMLGFFCVWLYRMGWRVCCTSTRGAHTHLSKLTIGSARRCRGGLKRRRTRAGANHCGERGVFVFCFYNGKG